MNIDIRSHIINNFKGDSQESLKNAIEDSIQNNDEITLPGMGVFFELIWRKADENMKSNMLNMLEGSINEK